MMAMPGTLRRSIALALPFDWKARRRHRSPGEPLGPYYIEWSPDSSTFGEDWDWAPRDADGVILLPDKRTYHPVRIAQYGLHRHARWRDSRSAADRQAFVAQADWLAQNQRVHQGVAGCYPYDFPNPRFNAAAGWISAMAQGEAISLLLRAFASERDQTYFTAALRAAEPFRFDLANGGVVFRTALGDTFLEEVAALPAAHILNGHIYSLWGLLELRGVYHEPWLDELARAALRTLRCRLKLYDSGFWSYYSLAGTPHGFRNVALLKYHLFHIAQLRVTAVLAHDQYFADVAERWERYARSPACRLRVLANTFVGLLPRFVTRSDRLGHGMVDLLNPHV
jgi:hypothetical protein